MFTYVTSRHTSPCKLKCFIPRFTHTISASLMDSGHDRRMVSIEHSGDIKQGIPLLISVPDNRFLFWRAVNPSSSFHGNVPLDLG